VAPLMVWYSQEARMYSLMMLLGVIAMWAQIRIVRRGGTTFVWSVYALASVALVWTQYFGLFQVIVQQVAFAAVVYGRRRRQDPRAPLLVGWLITGAIIAVALAPLVPFAHQQFVVNQTAGKGFGGPQQVGTGASSATAHLGVYSALANLIWAVWGYHSDPTMALLAALWPIGMLAALVLLGRRRQGVTSLLVAAVIGPGLAMFALGLVKRNLFDVRYLSTTVPILFVLVARLVTGIATRRALVALATAALVATLVGGLVDQQYNGANPRIYDFSQALQRVDAEARPGDLLLYDPSDLVRVVQYYSPHVRAQPLRSDVGSAGTTGRVFLLASRSLMNGSQDAGDLRHALIVLGARHRLLSRRYLANVEVWTFR